MSWLAKLKQRARALKAETYALYFAARHPHTPWHAKLMALLVVAYAFSPLDLVPDFVPVLGYLDDLILIPLGIALTLRWVPEEVMRECRVQAESLRQKPVNWVAGALIVLVWIALGTLAGWWAYQWWQQG